MMLNDYKCPRHGLFEASHPICGAMGCDSEGVEKVFLKAPGTKSDYTKRFDAGIKKSAAAYGQTNFLSAREGEVAKANNRASELKWGNDAASFLGQPGVDAMASAPRQPEGAQALSIVTANDVNPIARAERTGMKKQDDQWRKDLTTIAAPKN